MTLKFLGGGNNQEGFDFRDHLAYQMLPATGEPRKVGIMTDESHWVMASVPDKKAPATPPFEIDAPAGAEILKGRPVGFRLPPNSRFTFTFRGKSQGQYNLTLEPVNGHVPPIRFLLSVVPARLVPYVPFVIRSDATLKRLALDAAKMAEAFAKVEVAYKQQCNVDLMRERSPKSADGFFYIDSDFDLGKPIKLNERWAGLKVELDNALPGDRSGPSGGANR